MNKANHDKTNNMRQPQPRAMIGHIHLTVADLNRSLNFYHGLLGFQVTTDMEGAVFLSSGDYHHHIGLNVWKGPNAKPPPANATGLFHFAIKYSNRKELALIIRRIITSKYPIDGTADHGVSEAIYLRDPDGNGIELYVDRPKRKWPKDKNGKLVMYTKPLDIKKFLDGKK